MTDSKICPNYIKGKQMKLTIKYEKKNGKKWSVLEGCEYNLEFEKTVINEDVKNALNVIENEYIGDDISEYFYISEADAFSCYLDDDKKPIFENGKKIKESKKEPVAFVDGLIRRCKVKEAVLYDGEYTYIIKKPRAIENGRIKASKCEIKRCYYEPEYYESFDDETGGYHYDYMGEQCINDKLTFKNMVFCFMFQDSDKGGYINDRIFRGCASLLCILEGKQEKAEGLGSYEYGHIILIKQFDLKCDRQRDICLSGRRLPLLFGSIDYSYEASSMGDDNADYVAEGLFYSYHGKLKINGHCEHEDLWEHLGIYPFMVSIKQKNFEMKDIHPMAVMHSDPEKLITEGLLEINDPNTGFKEDICRQLNICIEEYGVGLNPKYLNSNKRVKTLSLYGYSESRKLVETIYEKFKVWEYAEAIKTYVETAAKEAGIKKVAQSINSEDKEKFYKELLDPKNTAIYYRSNSADRELYIIAVHEMGHAVAAKMQANNLDTVKTVTINPGETYGGYMNSKGWDYEKLPEDETATINNTERSIRCSLGSRAAEELIFGSVTRGWSQDYKDAQSYIVLAVMKWGELYYSNGEVMCKLPGERTPVRCKDVVDILLDRYMKETRGMLADKTELIRDLACRLMVEREIDGNAFNQWYNGYYERTEAVKLCRRLWMAIDTGRKIKWSDEKSKELVKKFNRDETGAIRLWELEDYAESLIAGYITQVAGFNIFERSAWRDSMIRSYPALSYAVAEKGGPCVIISKDGKLAVFMDRSDRACSGKTGAYSKSKGLTYDSLDYTNAIFIK